MAELNGKAVEAAAAALDPEIWAMDGPGLTRSEVQIFHQRRQDSAVAASATVRAYLSALPAPDDGLVEIAAERICLATGLDWGDLPEAAENDGTEDREWFRMMARAALQSKDEQIKRLTLERDDAKAALRIEQIRHGETIRNKPAARIDLKSRSILKYLEETRMWSASAFVAGETVPDPKQDMTDLYSFLCRLGNVLDAWADDFEAAEQQVQKITAALRGLVKAVGGMKNPQTVEDVALLVGVTLGPAFEFARSALETQEGGK